MRKTRCVLLRKEFAATSCPPVPSPTSRARILDSTLRRPLALETAAEGSWLFTQPSLSRAAIMRQRWTSTPIFGPVSAGGVKSRFVPRKVMS